MRFSTSGADEVLLADLPVVGDFGRRLGDVDGDRRGARSVGDGVGTVVAVHVVGAEAAVDRVVVAGCRGGVVAVAAERACRCRAAGEVSLPSPPSSLSLPLPPLRMSSPEPADERVVPVRAVRRSIAGAAVDLPGILSNKPT